jgi:preprotein translocase subunit SecF
MFVITHKNIFLGIAVVIMLASIALVSVLGLRLGIDFTGGSLTEVTYGEAPQQSDIETILTDYELGGFSVRGSVDDTGRSAFLIRTRDLAEAEREAITEQLTALGTDAELERFTSIGPVIGQELRDKAVWAIGGVVLIIVLYVAFAFSGIGVPVSSWVYGLTTIIVLIHDVLVPAAVMAVLGALAGVEVDVLFVMAILAVLGYSVNDTIVVFDRVRENLKQNRTEKRKKFTEPGGLEREEVTYTLTAPYPDIVGMAVNQTLARSINTSVTTMVALLALYVLGGDVTKTFALILIAGVVAGAYSSICIASPLVVAYAEWKSKRAGTNK